MLALSSLNKLLGHVLAPPALHTAVLFTAAGALVSYATAASSPESSSNPRPKDDIRVLVGLASEVWAETKEDGEGMVDSELGRIIVLPIVPTSKQQQEGGSGNSNNSGNNSTSSSQPPKDSALLIALNATDDIEWGDLQHKAQTLAAHLSKPLEKLQAKLDSTSPPLSKTTRR
ncbi:hypothetical protein A7U60_g3827 [Sanghuangporus baumii]|uniref:Uncharacterized protein n=1 Tax=Sanghuangporus baumii TaxID=108892 RepID=A0A9Q5HZS8_SANBA|nr:hypothetical protein A7U60_g3827 [Sanghuangporus baumii]